MLVNKLRQETRGCDQIVHFNHASASLAPNIVIETMQNYLFLEQSHGPTEAQTASLSMIEKIYEIGAKLLNCSKYEIALTQGATHAWHTLLQAIPWQQGDIVLTTPLEHINVYLALLQLNKLHGVVIETIPLKNGTPDLSQLQLKLSNKVKLVSISHLPSHGGRLIAANEIGNLLQSSSCYYALDAAQSIGQVPIDVEEIQCDFLIATGRKHLRAPRGTGLLFARQKHLSQLIPNYASMSSTKLTEDNRYYEINKANARFLEAPEASYALRLGFAAAIDYALAIGMKNIQCRIQELANYLISQLVTIKKLKIITDLQNSSAIVTCACDTPSEMISQALRQRPKPINIRSWSRSASPLATFDGAEFLRFSIHYYNTHEEIDELLVALRDILK